MENYSNSPRFLIFTISITFPMQMDFNSPNFFCQTSYSLYSPNFFTIKFFYHTVANNQIKDFRIGSKCCAYLMYKQLSHVTPECTLMYIYSCSYFWNEVNMSLWVPLIWGVKMLASYTNSYAWNPMILTK